MEDPRDFPLLRLQHQLLRDPGAWRRWTNGADMVAVGIRFAKPIDRPAWVELLCGFADTERQPWDRQDVPLEVASEWCRSGELDQARLAPFARTWDSECSPGLGIVWAIDTPGMHFTDRHMSLVLASMFAGAAMRIAERATRYSVDGHDVVAELQAGLSCVDWAPAGGRAVWDLIFDAWENLYFRSLGRLADMIRERFPTAPAVRAVNRRTGGWR